MNNRIVEFGDIIGGALKGYGFNLDADRVYKFTILNTSAGSIIKSLKYTIRGVEYSHGFLKARAVRLYRDNIKSKEPIVSNIINFTPARLKEVNAVRIDDAYLNEHKDPLKDYGFDLTKDAVVSYKQSRGGSLLARRRKYVLNGMVYNHITLGTLAKKIAGTAPVKEVEPPQLADTAKKVAMVVENKNNDIAVATAIATATPQVEYIMYSTVHKCSQYFKAGTSLGAASKEFARRGINIGIDEFKLMDPNTGLPIIVDVERIVTCAVTFK